MSFIDIQKKVHFLKVPKFSRDLVARQEHPMLMHSHKKPALFHLKMNSLKASPYFNIHY